MLRLDWAGQGHTPLQVQARVLVSLVLEDPPRAQGALVTLHTALLEPVSDHLPGVDEEEGDHQQEDHDGADDDDNDLGVVTPGPRYTRALMEVTLELHLGDVLVPEAGGTPAPDQPHTGL